jgi:hypothetical protein
MSNPLEKIVRPLPTRIIVRGLIMIATVSFSALAWSDGDLYDTHPQVMPEKAKVEDCGALDDELSRLAKYAHNPAATPKQIEANKARATKLESRRAQAQCPGKIKS